jgi:hypothetical protein
LFAGLLIRGGLLLGLVVSRQRSRGGCASGWRRRPLLRPCRNRHPPRQATTAPRAAPLAPAPGVDPVAVVFWTGAAATGGLAGL